MSGHLPSPKSLVTTEEEQQQQQPPAANGHDQVAEAAATAQAAQAADPAQAAAAENVDQANGAPVVEDDSETTSQASRTTTQGGGASPEVVTTAEADDALPVAWPPIRDKQGTITPHADATGHLLKLVFLQTGVEKPERVGVPRYPGGAKRPAEDQPVPNRPEVMWRYANFLALQNQELNKRVKTMSKTIRTISTALADLNGSDPGAVAVPTGMTEAYQPASGASSGGGSSSTGPAPRGAASTAMVEALEDDGPGEPVAVPWLPTHPTQRVKQLPPEVAARIADEFELVMRHDIKNLDGQLFVPGGENNATLCGAFPHGILGGPPGSNERPRHYVCFDKQVIVNVSIRKKSDPSNKAVTEQSVLSMIRDAVPPEARRDWTTYDSQIVLYLEMRFHNETDPDGAASKIHATQPSDPAKGPACSFVEPPHNGHLLVPAETGPYQHDPHYELSLENGHASFWFHTNQGVYEQKLSNDNKNARFVFRVRCLNPYLANIPGFSLTSMPFRTRSSFGRIINKDEWYVSDPNTGTPQICPRAKVRVTAPCPRRR